MSISGIPVQKFKPNNPFYPVKGGEKIERGAATVILDGLLQNANGTEGVAAGLAVTPADNTGGVDGAIECEVESCGGMIAPGLAVTLTSFATPVYVSGPETFTTDPALGVRWGKLHQIFPNGAGIYFESESSPGV